MSLYAAFLRGMNVGGHRITNAELCEHVRALGFGEVASFRASGNVVFAGEHRPAQEVRAAFEEGLRDALGYAVPTFVRSAEQMRELAAAQPFEPERLRRSKGKLQVALLGSSPTAEAEARLREIAGETDALAFAAHAVYWLPAGGLLDSPLTNRLERHLGELTVRTKGTIELMTSRFFAEERR